MSEEKRIMDKLGRPEIDGEVRGRHLGKVLTYLKTIKSEEWDKTISKLSLVLGMNSRYIRENYLKGLLYFDIIKLYRNSNALYWQWIGESALKGSVIPSNSEQVLDENQEIKEIKDIKKPEPDYKKEWKKAKVEAKKKPEKKPEKKNPEPVKEHEEIKEGCCPICGKKLKKNMKFCNEECLREHYKKKKEKIK